MKAISNFISHDLIEDFTNSSDVELKIDKKITSGFMKRIYKEAIKGNNILIVGDYDVDGFFSTIQLEQYIKLLEARVRDVSIDNSRIDTYYTKREHGYEMPKSVFDKLSSEYNLIIFLDTGSSFDYFNENTKNVLIFDHHPNNKKQLPFIYNPNKNNEISTSTGRIIYDIIDSFENEMRSYFGKHKIKQHDIMRVNKMLAGVTLCSDMAEMSFSNKVFLKEALELMSDNNKNIAWVSSINSNSISNLDLSFNIINKINSYSRLGRDLKGIEDIFKVGVDMYEVKHLSSSKKTYDLFKQLDEVHSNRKQITSKLDKVIGVTLKDKYVSEQNIIAVKIENEYSGINGLLSQNILNTTAKSNLVLSYDKSRDTYVGSGRGRLIKKAVEIFLKENPELKQQIKYGGHSMAIGLSVEKDIIDEFVQGIEKIIVPNQENQSSQEKFYYASGVRDYKEAVDYYSNLSPTTSVQERYFAIIDNYKNLGIIEKNNGWFCSTIKDKSDCITLYFKEDDIETIRSNSPIMLEVTNQINQNYFIEHKEIETKLFEYMENVPTENNQGGDTDYGQVDEDEISFSSLMMR